MGYVKHTIGVLWKFVAMKIQTLRRIIFNVEDIVEGASKRNYKNGVLAYSTSPEIIGKFFFYCALLSFVMKHIHRRS